MSDLHPLPVLPPCPSWCTLPIGHQPASGDDACWVRSHVAFCSEHVSVEAVETYEVGMRADVEAPRILVCDVDNRLMSAPEARALAAELLDVAQVLQQITAARWK